MNTRVVIVAITTTRGSASYLQCSQSSQQPKRNTAKHSQTQPTHLTHPTHLTQPTRRSGAAPDIIHLHELD